MGHQKMRNEQMINQTIQNEEEGKQMYGQFYPENYYNAHQGLYQGQGDFRRSYDYSQGYRYPSPVGRQRRDPGMFAPSSYYKNKSRPAVYI